jgi:starch phosphorylase
MYRQGYFRQRLDVSGWQQEYWIDSDPERLPAALVREPDGRPLTITVPIRGREVSAQIWRVAVGQVALFLLDADVPGNGRLGRWITSQLYVADPITRLSQYALLGVGGVRALAALGIEPSLVHLNEGHAAFAVLELAGGELARGASVEAALEAARQKTVFTTHTPVAAGNETYPRQDVIDTIGGAAAQRGVDPELLIRLGRYHPQDGQEPRPRRRGARDVARSVARAALGDGADHPCHQRRTPAKLGRARDARAA